MGRPPKRRSSGRMSSMLRRLQPVWLWLNKGSVRQRLIRAFLIMVGAGVVYTGWLLVTLPDISDPRTLIAAQSSVITDRNGIG